jgi:hypothetical protein
MEVSGHFHALVALPRGKIIRSPLHLRLGGAQSLSGRGGEKTQLQILLSSSSVV